MKKCKKYIAVIILVFMAAITGVSRESAEGTETSIIPTTVEGLNSFGTTTLNIQNYQDWINLQTLSQCTTLKGIEIVINSYNGNKWQLNNSADFVGLGTSEYPFEGTMHMYQSGITIDSAVPIFRYLSPKADVYNMAINCIDSTSGLAQNMAGLAADASDADALFTLKDVHIMGTIKNDSGAAGGLFGSMTGKSIIDIGWDTSYYNGLNVECSSISGQYAGAIAGEVTQNTTIRINSMLKTLPASVTSTGAAAGGLIGSASAADGEKITIQLNGITDISNTQQRAVSFNAPIISGTGNTGGLIGYAKNVHMEANDLDNVDIRGTYDASFVNITSPIINAGDSAGGMFGLVENSDVQMNDTILGVTGITAHSEAGNAGGIAGTAVDFNLTANKTTNVSQCASTSTSGYCGGYYGSITVSEGNDYGTRGGYSTDILVNSGAKSAGAFAGDISGNGSYYIDAVTVRNLYLNGYNGVGGIAGRIDGNNVSIVNSKVFYTTPGVKSSIYTNANAHDYADKGSIGGVVGELSGSCSIKDIEIRDIETGIYSIGTKEVTSTAGAIGGVIGRIKGDTDEQHVAAINNIALYGRISGTKIQNHYAGGMIGAAECNSVVELSGSIYMPNAVIAYGNYTYSCVLVGYQKEALIYRQQDYVLNYNPNSAGDMVGGYGGVYINQLVSDTQNLLSIDDNLNFHVNNKIEYRSGRYILKNLQDVETFAIALNTEGYCGADAFTNDEVTATAENMRAASYSITADEINLEAAGIETLNRNDSQANNEDRIFTGEIISEAPSGNTTITNNVGTYFHPNLGLFRGIGGGCTFKNLTLNVSYTMKKAVVTVGGLAAFAIGDVNLENVNVNTKIRDVSWWTSEYFGGVIGRYYVTSDETLKADNMIVNADITNSFYLTAAGGFIGSVYLQDDTGTGNINVNNCTIGGTIVSKDGGHLGSNNERDRRAEVGGFIGVIGAKNNSMTGNACSYSYCINQNSYNRININVDGLAINNMAVTSQAGKGGGLLGDIWQGGSYYLKNVTVDNSSISVRGSFGAMISEAFGRMTLDGISMGTTGDVTINQSSWNSSERDPDNGYSGLLVGDGRYLYLSVHDYILNKDKVNVSLETKYADEIVGTTVGVYNDDTKRTTGGITTISGKTPENTEGETFLNAAGNYYSYKNQVLTAFDNPNTRYYYDVDSHFAGSKITDIQSVNADIVQGKINNVSDLMSLQIARYANQGLSKYFYNNSSKALANIIAFSLGDDIDLSGCSYYPMGIAGYNTTTAVTFNGNNHKITFGSDNINTHELEASDLRQPYRSDKQHYMMQSGLFFNATMIKISDLVLSGSVAAYTDDDGTDKSGALICRGLTGASSIKNINLDNLWVTNKNAPAVKENWAGNYGLMVGKVNPATSVDFANISMTGYSDADTASRGHAASALIGIAGGDSNDAVDIHMTFVNMDIADAEDSKSSTELNNSKSDEVLAYASFIYYYNYSATSGGLYTFSYDDFIYGTGNKTDTQAHKVTVGNELWEDDAVSTYYYDKEHNGMLVGEGDDVKSAYKSAFKADCYKPYVYTKQIISVNPKTGDVTNGCGTYEDPYIIESPSQLMALYWYINEKASNITNLDGWTINYPKNDKTVCDGTETTITFNKAKSNFVNSKGTTVDVNTNLRNAYYMIKGKINMSKTAYKGFRGLGTSQNPFTGVITGDGADLSTVRMPAQSVSTNVSAYGLVQCAKGAVVQNLTIDLQDVNNMIVNGSCAGAIGCITGGDNIISGVKVTGSLSASDTSSCIGAYVGELQLGSIAIRNMTSDMLNKFFINYGIDGTKSSDSYNGDYCFANGIVGRVKDGFAVYEGYADGSNPVIDFAADNTIYNNNLDPSRTYQIVNETWLNENKTENGIKVTYDSGTKTYTYNIHNAAEMQIMTMAFNAGVLNYAYNGLTEVGYSLYSRCRTGDYSYIGKDISDTTTDAYKAYEQVITEDNINGKQPASQNFYAPYAFKYFNMSDADTYLSTNSYVNAVSNLNIYNMSRFENFVLTEGTYDMRMLGNAFRGFGGRFYTDKCNNIFHGGFDGNGSVIKMNMIVDALQNVNNHTGLFNEIKGGVVSATTCTIQNFTLTGKVVNCTDLSTGRGENQDVTVSESTELNKGAAGLTTFVTGRFDFKNITLDNLDVISQDITAGFLKGCANGSVVNFEHCNITGTDSDHSVIRGQRYAGGLIAYSYMNTGFILNDCNVRYADISALDTTSSSVVPNPEASTYYMAGGLFGYMYNNTGAGSIEMTGCGIEDSTVSAYGEAGGLFAYMTNFRINATGTTKVNNLTINLGGRPAVAGGIIGTTNYPMKMNDISIKKLDIESTGNEAYINVARSYNCIYMGGVVGLTTSSFTANDVSIGDNTEDGYIRLKTSPNGTTEARVGGMIGYNTTRSTMTVNNYSFTGAALPDGSHTNVIQSGNIAAGFIGHAVGDITINGSAKVSNVDLTARYTLGGLIGYASTNNNTIYLNINTKDITIEDMNCRCVAASTGTAVGAIMSKSNNIYMVADGDININNINAYGGNLLNGGGMFGYVQWFDGKFNGESNTISNCNIAAARVGAITGAAFNYNTTGTPLNLSMNNLTVSNNRLIASYANNYTDSDLVPGNTVDYLNTIYTAGGLVGYVEGNVKLGLDMTKVNITDNYIAGIFARTNTEMFEGKTTSRDIFSYTAGMFGSINTVSDVAHLNDVYMKNNYVGLLNYTDIPETDCSLYDGIISPVTGSITAQKGYAINRKETYLFNTDKSVIGNLLGICGRNASTSVKPEPIPEVIPASDMNKYAWLTGNIAGFINKTTKCMNIINFNMDNSDIGDKYSLPGDIGMSSNYTYNTYTVQNMRNYHQNVCTVIYGDYKNNGGMRNGASAADTTVNNDAIADTLKTLYSQDDYQFASLKNIWDDYCNVDFSRTRAFKLITNYGQNSDFDDVYGKTFYSQQKGYLSSIKDASGKTIPMIEYKAENGLIDEVMNSYINILTNNGGSVNTVNSSVIKNVTTAQMSISYDGANTIIQKTEDSPSIGVTNDSGKYVFSLLSDNDFTEGTGGTFTMVHVEYYDGSDTGKVFNLDIPIYAEPRLKIETHMRMFKGVQYDINHIRNNGEAVTFDSIANQTDTAVTIPQSDVYTLYTEYLYNEIRNSYDSVSINKEIYFQRANSTEPMELPVGIRFTLIDITDGSKAYYYTVNEVGKTRINFTDFTNEDDTFATHNISDTSKYPTVSSYSDVCGEVNKNVGVEKFMIIVDPSDVGADNTSLQALYYAKVTSEQMEQTNTDLWKRVNYIQHCCCKVSGVTNTIAKFNTAYNEETNEYNTQATGAVAATEKMTVNTAFDISAAAAYWYEIKNSSTTDYMDVELYLEKEGKRVPFPVGTKVTMNGTTKYLFGGETELYYYKDSESQCSMKGLADIINTSNTASMKTSAVFEFPSDMGDFESGNYSVYAKLITCTDRDFPGSGNVRDTWNGTISSQGEDNISFAVKVNDLKTLGMNAYSPEASDAGIVDYKLRIEFPEYLIKDTTKAMVDRAAYASDKYVIEYQIQKKNEDGTYDAYTGDDIRIYDDTSENVTDETVPITGSLYEITEQEIIDSIKNANPIEKNVCIKADTQKLMDANDTITNYRLTAVLKVMDYSLEKVIYTTSDYFVFTAAKIQTDIK